MRPAPARVCVVLLLAASTAACGASAPAPSLAAEQALALRADRAAVVLDADRRQQAGEREAGRRAAQQHAVAVRAAAEAARAEAERVAAERVEAERVAAERAAAERAAAEQAAAQRAAEQAASPPATARSAARASGPAAVAPQPAAAPRAAAPVSDGAAYAAEVLRLTNVERSRAGVPALAASSCARSWAGRWSQRMADTGDFSHQPLEPVLEDCGARGVGENIGYGNSTPAEMVRLWMDSAGHRENILRPQFTHLGVGAAQRGDGRWYVTQDFLTL